MQTFAAVLLCLLLVVHPALGQDTVEIDPAASDAITIITPQAEQPKTKGSVTEALDDAVPDTGVESVDGAVSTFNSAIGDLVQGFIAILPQLVIALLVLIVAAFLVRLTDTIVTRLMRKAHLRASLRDLFRIAIRTAVWFAALLIAAGIIFPGFGFAQLMATAGLASIAIGFAFQDIFGNFFAGVLILWKFPFENGDFIEVDGIKGKVEDVQIRMTLIRQTDNDLVLVPNSTIFKNNVTVYTNRPQRRLSLAVGIAYGEDIETSRELIRKATASCASVKIVPPPEVLAVAFGASSIDFDVLWYTGNTPIDERRSRDQVVQAIKSALDEAGVEIPYPYRTLTFSKNEPDIIKALSRHAARDRDPE